MGQTYSTATVNTERDLDQALRLWSVNLGLTREECEAKYKWFYQNGPYGRGIVQLLQSSAGECIGVGGVGYRRFYRKGKEFVAAVIADLAVDERYRVLGPALALERSLMEAVRDRVAFLYAFPNPRAQSVLAYLGYRKACNLTRLVKLTRSRPLLERFLGAGALVSFFSVPLDLVMRLTRPRKGARADPFESASFDEHFSRKIDSLWERMIAEDLLFSDKSARYLRWRYVLCPHIHYRLFGVRDHAGAVAGVIIFYIRNGRAIIADLSGPVMSSPELIRALLTQFEQFCYDGGVSSISISAHGNESFMQTLVSTGYRMRDAERSVHVYAGGNEHDLSYEELSRALWLAGDEDNN